MFDTSTPMDTIGDNIGTSNNSMGLSTSDQQVWTSYNMPIFTNSTTNSILSTISGLELTNNHNNDNNYMPSLIESMESMAPIEVQSCTSGSIIDQDHQMAVNQCLPRLEDHHDHQIMGVNGWGMIESQSCPNLLYWDQVEGLDLSNIGDEEHQFVPPSLNTGTLLSSFPSPL